VGAALVLPAAHRPFSCFEEHAVRLMREGVLNFLGREVFALSALAIPHEPRRSRSQCLGGRDDRKF
jgi:hypothetical protein